MNFKNYFMGTLLIGLGLVQLNCQAEEIFAYLTGISNPYGFDVTVQSSDRQGSIILKDSKSQTITPNKNYNLKDIESMSFVIPWDHWDGDATIHVRVKDEKGNTISQADLLDRNSKMIINNIKNAASAEFDKESCRADVASPQKPCICLPGIFLSIDPSGRILHRLDTFYISGCSRLF